MLNTNILFQNDDQTWYDEKSPITDERELFHNILLIYYLRKNMKIQQE